MSSRLIGRTTAGAGPHLSCACWSRPRWFAGCLYVSCSDPLVVKCRKLPLGWSASDVWTGCPVASPGLRMRVALVGQAGPEAYA